MKSRKPAVPETKIYRRPIPPKKKRAPPPPPVEETAPDPPTVEDQPNLAEIDDLDDEDDDTQEQEEQTHEKEEQDEDSSRLSPQELAAFRKSETLATLQRITLSSSLPWGETLVVSADTPFQVSKIDDDQERELVFYAQALAAANKGYALCGENEIKTRRPDDYFAEMVKSDEHLRKIQVQLSEEKKRLKAIEHVARIRKNRQFAKEANAPPAKRRKTEFAPIRGKPAAERSGNFHKKPFPKRASGGKGKGGQGGKGNRKGGKKSH